MKRPPKALKTLLWVSELREKKAQEDFQRGQQAVEEIEKLLVEISKRPKEMYNSLEKKTVRGADLEDFAWGLEMAMAEKLKVEKILVQKKKEVEDLREKALRLYQKRRTAEALYQKAWKQYMENLKKEEFKNLDDLMLMRRKRHETL